MDDLRTRLNTLEQQTAALTRHTHRLTSQLRWWRGVACGLVALALLTWALPVSTAQEDGRGGLASRLAALEHKLRFLTVTSDAEAPPEVRITGANLRIVNGLGSTDCTDDQGEPLPDCPNGLGNLIVGYNELRGEFEENLCTGSHNVVVGQGHNFSRFGGLVVGFQNEISGNWSAVSGGRFNRADGESASVSGGQFNRANGESASVSGGEGSSASGEFASVSGGLENGANGKSASVSGGRRNIASGEFASVSGGGGIIDPPVEELGNIASGRFATVCGGARNVASGDFATVCGGSQNTASGGTASVSGGEQNTASGGTASVSGGLVNTASEVYAVVSGGQENVASGFAAVVGGGLQRTAAGEFDWVAGPLFADE